MNLKIYLTALVATAISFGFSFASALAQSYKPGDRVQALWANKWESGTVMPLLSNDLDKSGRVMRIKLDCLQDFLQPDGTEILAKDVRPGGAPPAQGAAATAPSTGGTGHQTGSGSTATSGGANGAIGASGFRVGDRVSLMWAGKPATGTVVPMQRLDLDKSGRVLRVKIDGLADFLQPDGTEVMAKDVQHSNAPPPPAAQAHGNPAAATNTSPATQPAAPPAAGTGTKRNTDYKTPVMNGAVPNLTGTAWKMLYDEAKNVVPVIRFTKRGTYDTVRYGLGSGMQGNYRQSGSTVFLNNEAYSMKFDGGSNILLLTGGGTTLKLLYNGITSD